MFTLWTGKIIVTGNVLPNSYHFNPVHIIIQQNII